MRIYLIISAITIMLGYTMAAQADQRIDRDSNNCHISPDPNDDDNEIDVPCTIYMSQVNRYTEDGVRKARGSFVGEYKVLLSNARVKPDLFIANPAGDFILVGSANTRSFVDETITASNTDCDLVRSNYQENTGSDDQNQTEYSTNDWDLTVKWKGLENIEGDTAPEFQFGDPEFDYNEDGVVDLSDYSLFRSEYEIGVWNIANNCRNGVAQ